MTEYKPTVIIEPLVHHPEFVLFLSGHLYHEWPHIMEFENMEADDMRSELASRTGIDGMPVCFVALSGGGPAGCASLIPSDLEESDLSSWLADLLVLPDFRGKGIGRALVGRVEEQAASLGYRRLYLFTEDRTSLYRSLGWHDHHREVYAGREVTVMERILPGRGE